MGSVDSMSIQDSHSSERNADVLEDMYKLF